MEGVCLGPRAENNLHLTVRKLLAKLFPEHEIRCSDSYFPFTDPSWEYEVQIGGKWVEVLGCGLIKNEIICNCGLDGEEGWAFGLGLDRLAMILFEIPDIRLLWSVDPRFTRQFTEERITLFVPFSHQPACYKDVSFWLADGFNYNILCETVREIGGDLIESISEIDHYVKDDREAKCYRVSYRTVDRTLTNEEVDKIQDRIRRAICLELKCELR
jgi:phenylalanyl-tRNA synthetase alpha chain